VPTTKYKQSQAGSGGQMMNPGVITAPEDKWAGQAREDTYNYMNNMMSNVQSGKDTMQNMRDQQEQHAVDKARRDMFGSQGDRNQSIVGMGQQQMSLFGANPKQMLAQKKKSQNALQFQLADIRDRIRQDSTKFMEKQSFFAPEMMNKLRTGPKMAGAYGPQYIPGGGGGGGGMDMDGITGMVEGVGGLVGKGMDAWKNRGAGSTANQMANWTKSTGQTAVGGGASAWQPSSIPSTGSFSIVK